MNKRPNSIILSHKTGTLCWEADANGKKLRNLFQIFKNKDLQFMHFQVGPEVVQGGPDLVC